MTPPRRLIFVNDDDDDNCDGDDDGDAIGDVDNVLLSSLQYNKNQTQFK